MGTPSDQEAAVKSIIQRIQAIVGTCEKKKIEGIGITLPGRFQQDTNRLIFAPNLKWRDVDLRNPIAKATGLEVELENAASACVLATVWFSRLEACGNLLVSTVSEGIGTGILINGQLARGLNSMAGGIRG